MPALIESPGGFLRSRGQLVGRVFATAGLLVAALAGGCSAGSSGPGEAGTGVDAIVLVVVDALRADHLGAYGYQARPTSPEIDRWAGRGRLFERAWASSSWTLPSFGSLLTGRLPSAHAAGAEVAEGAGVDFVVAAARNFVPLPEGMATLPELLGAHGFATGALVSNPFLDPGFGLGRGFEYYDNFPTSNSELRGATEAVDQALQWLDANAARPRFLMLHLFEPHLDYDAPPPHRGAFTAGTAGVGERELPVRGLWPIRNRIAEMGAPERDFIAAAYDEEIAAVDAAVGRLLAGLEERELLDRGLVLLTADHGEELFEHGGFEHGHGMYEEVLRVPLLLWGAGVTAGRETLPVSLLDVAPTVLAAAGLTSAELPGVSLLDGARPEWPAERTIIAERLLYGPETKAIVRWPYKVIAGAGGADGGAEGTAPESGATEGTTTEGTLGRQAGGANASTAGTVALLFDLQADPGERHDLAAARPGLLGELLGALAARLAEADAHAAAGAAELDDALLRRLRALGYIR
jgi:arylsulfatase A-like enzyme